MEAGIIFFLIFVAVFLITIAGIWKTFVKAGRSGWESLIPVYNNYVMLRIGGHSGWWVLTFLLPVLPWLIGVATSVANAQTATATMSTTSFGSTGVQQFSVPLEQFVGFGGVLASVLVVLMLLLVYAFFTLTMLVSVVMTYDLARSFGKGMGFTLGLLVFPFIFWPVLGFSDAQYRGPVAHPNMVADGSGAHTEAPEPTQREGGGGGDPFVS